MISSNETSHQAVSVKLELIDGVQEVQFAVMKASLQQLEYQLRQLAQDQIRRVNDVRV